MNSSSAVHGDEEVNSKSGSQNSGEERQSKRRRFHRHTLQQIEQLEAFFKECPHPDDKQRKELSRQLGMEPIQVKFWFQNKRTQMKMQHEHKENSQLRAENEKLRAENERYKDALNSATCVNCRGPPPTPPRVGETSFHEQQLRVENSRLRKEIDHISSITTKYVGNPTPANPIGAPSGSTPAPPVDMLRPVNNEGTSSEGCRPSEVINLAASAMEEVLRMAQMREPLWISLTVDRSSGVLNEEEYLRDFSVVFGRRMDGFKLEASRESTVVATTAANVVHLFMNMEQWANVFCGVVARATLLQVLSPGVGGTYHEALQLISAEFQVPSPLVPTREFHFLRYCRRIVEGTWAVVDVSIDHLHSGAPRSCRRRPSGCLLQEMPNGRSQVIWVEHVEIDERSSRSIYKPLIAAGLAFGSRRWVAILDGYCQRLERVFAAMFPSDDVDYLLGGNGDSKRNMLNLAERMVRRFYRGVNTSILNTWTTVPGNGSDNVKMMTRKNMEDPSMPFGVHLSIATSFWLPVPPKRVFEFLCDQTMRKEWDMLLSGGDVEEMAHIMSGREEGDRVTIYQLKDAGSSINPMIVLQESHSDPTASYVIYAPIAMACANAVLAGGDPSYAPLLPSGFAILPDGPAGGLAALVDTGGSLLTIALQILMDSSPTANISVGSVAVANKVLNYTVDRIKQALIPPQF